MRAGLLLLLSGCAPLIAGPGRVLPVALQYDPASFVGKPVPRTQAPAERLTLPNGLEVFWVGQEHAPLIDLQLLVRCGRGDEPVGGPGLTELMLHTALAGGAGPRDAKAQTLAFDAVPHRIGIDDGESWLQFTTAPDDLPLLLGLVRDLLESPRFEPAAFALLRDRNALRFESAAYRRRAHEHFLHNGAIYGSVPALSQRQTPTAVRALTLDMVRAHADRCFQPPNLVLALAGDFAGRSMREVVAPLAVLKGSSLIQHLPPGTPPQARTVWLAPSAQESRVEVTVLGPGLPPGSPDRAAAEVLMSILLGWVIDDLRLKMGHVYSVEGEFEVGPGTGAAWLRFTTRAEVAHEAVRRVLQLFQNFWDRWPLDSQVTEDVVKRLRKKTQRASGINRAFAAARARMQDGPAFDARSFLEQLDQLSAPQLSQLFVRSFKPERLQIIVSGAVDPRLDWAQFGKVVAAPHPGF